MDRRSLLKTLGVTGVMGVTAPCMDRLPRRDGADQRTPSATGAVAPATRTTVPTRQEPGPHEFIAFDRVVDGVDDLGMDPTGGRAIDDALDAALTDGTLVELPPGQYLTTRRHTVPSLKRWGIRGTSDHRGGTRILPPAGAGLFFLNVRAGRDILVENLTFDVRPGPHEWLTNVFKVDDGLWITDVEYAGFYASEVTGRNLDPEFRTTGPLHVHVMARDGVARIDNLVRRGPTHHADYPGGTSCIFVGPDETVGTVVVSNSHIENMSSHGIYASRTRGTIRIENTTFKNNNGSNCRISGPNSVIKDSHIVLDTADVIDGTTGDLFNSLTTGIWIESGFRTQAGGTIDGCRISMRAVPDRVRGIEVDGSAGHTTIRDTTIEVDGSVVRPLDINRPGRSGSRVRTEGSLPADPRVELDGVRISGDAPGPGGAIDLVGRPGSTIANCHIDIAGDRDAIAIQEADEFRIDATTVRLRRAGDGLRIRDSGGGHVADSSVSVQDFPVVVAFAGKPETCPIYVTTGTVLESTTVSMGEVFDLTSINPAVQYRAVTLDEGCLVPPGALRNGGEIRVIAIRNGSGGLLITDWQ